MTKPPKDRGSLLSLDDQRSTARLPNPLNQFFLYCVSTDWYSPRCWLSFSFIFAHAGNQLRQWMDCKIVVLQLLGRSAKRKMVANGVRPSHANVCVLDSFPTQPTEQTYPPHTSMWGFSAKPLVSMSQVSAHTALRKTESYYIVDTVISYCFACVDIYRIVFHMCMGLYGIYLSKEI